MPEKKARIGELLVSSGLVREEHIQEALRMQHRHGGTLGGNLVRLGFVSEEVLLGALSEQLGLQHVNLPKVEIPPSVQRLVKIETVRKRRLLPIGFEGKRLVIGMVDPTDVAALAEVEFQSGHSTKPVILSSVHFDAALEFFQANGYAAKTLKLPEEKPPKSAEGTAGDLASLLRALVSWKGQELHLSAGAVPSVRVDDEMWRLSLSPLKPSEIERIVQDILTEEQKRVFRESCELDFAYSLEGVGRFRCNLYKQRGTIAFSARLVVDSIPGAAELGLPDFLREFALRKQGLILITGPNGHGKSNTLACLVDTVNRERKANIICIEDPVEFTHRHKSSNVNQREVGTDTPSFAEGLHRIFRQNPDVLVVGELRDPESISVALTAAETGRLVIATIFAVGAAAALERIADAFPPDRQPQIRAQLADALLVVFSQRLLRRASGAGRVLAWEKISSSLRVRNAIREGKVATLKGMMQTNVEELVGIDWNLAELVASGKVKYDEALKAADSPPYLNELLKVRGVFR